MVEQRLLSVFVGLCAALSGGAAAAAEPPTIDVKVLSFRLAHQAAVAAAEDCREQGYQVAAAVVDRQGRLLAFARDPLAGPHTIDIAQRKAYSAATYQTPTSAMMDRDALKATPGVFLVGGGVPIEAGGHFYGGIGVSGAPAEDTPGDVDEACARAGIDAVRADLEFGG